MKNYKNNFRRNRYKNHIDRNHQKNGNGSILINDFQNGSNFQRKNYGRNNHNASKLIEKYSNLAREALSNGDKILSENYFQHAEHFVRVLEEKESFSNIKQVIKDSKPNPEINDQEKNVENENNLQNNKTNLV
jgi:hypothetical protein|tara:strand:+ start:10509 stop:10907 length:399 start_codon:yes stop_codon:yes gene_type:complete